MAVPVGTDRDHRCSGPDRVEPGDAGRARRSVVTHLQQLRGPAHQRQRRLRREPCVTGEHGVEPAVRHPDDHRVLVGREMSVDPWLRWVKHREGHRVQPQRVAGPRGSPGGPRFIHGPQVVEVQGRAQRLSRLEHQVGVQRGHDARNAAQVVRVPVRGDDQIQAARTLPPEERKDHAASCVPLGRARPAVDQRPAAMRRADHDRVSLAHVQHVEREPAAIAARGNG